MQHWVPTISVGFSCMTPSAMIPRLRVFNTRSLGTPHWTSTLEEITSFLHLTTISSWRSLRSIADAVGCRGPFRTLSRRGPLQSTASRSRFQRLEILATDANNSCACGRLKDSYSGRLQGTPPNYPRDDPRNPLQGNTDAVPLGKEQQGATPGRL